MIFNFSKKAEVSIICLVTLVLVFGIIWGIKSARVGSENKVGRDNLPSIGQQVEWEGKIATDLSQIDGIKFYFVELKTKTVSTANWFWAAPEDLTSLTAKQTDGKWVRYMFKRFGDIDIDKIDPEKDTFLVSGRFDYQDCDYLNGHVCIPVIKVDRIKKVEK
jgi:hypothetical protein